VDVIGQTDQANHQYDLTDFWKAAVYGTLPAVSFIKFQSANTGHPSDSSALAEQRYLVDTINALERLPEWNSMAILITYDDSDGFYDHVMPPIVSLSNDPANDTLMGPVGMCGMPAAGAYLDRCGYGPRLPFLAISPFAKQNFVDSTVTDLTSILRFIEDNWSLGRLGDQSFDGLAGSILNMFDFSGKVASPLFLDPDTGLVAGGQ
jgi:phospholipase C